MPYFADKLEDDFAVFLDDCHRGGEQNIAKQWSEKYNLSGLFLPEREIYASFILRE